MQELLRRPIAYHVTVAKAFGSIQLAILWSQFYYWSDKTDDSDGWIYKTADDIYNETALKRRGQQTARVLGVELGVLEEERKGMPAKMHFRINMEKAIEIIEEYANLFRSAYFVPSI